jgi:hypothetical protein
MRLALNQRDTRHVAPSFRNDVQHLGASRADSRQNSAQMFARSRLAPRPCAQRGDSRANVDELIDGGEVIGQDRCTIDEGVEVVDQFTGIA